MGTFSNAALRPPDVDASPEERKALLSLLKRLEPMQLVARETDPEDRRMAWLRVTPDGVKLLQRSRKRKEAFLAKQMRSLEPRQLAVLQEATGILEQIVEGDR